MQEKSVTARQYARMRLDGPSELVDGKVVHMAAAGAKHGLVVGWINGLLTGFVEGHGLGMVTSGETGFLVRRDPDVVRAPDIAFLSEGSIARAQASKEPFIPFAPDLAVEVLSPSDSWIDVDRKAREYLAAKGRLVWVANPATETVYVYAPRVRPRVLEKDDEIDGGDVLPGFRARVAAFFGEKARRGSRRGRS